MRPARICSVSEGVPSCCFCTIGLEGCPSSGSHQTLRSCRIQAHSFFPWTPSLTQQPALNSHPLPGAPPLRTCYTSLRQHWSRDQTALLLPRPGSQACSSTAHTPAQQPQVHPGENRAAKRNRFFHDGWILSIQYRIKEEGHRSFISRGTKYITQLIKPTESRGSV